MDMAYTRTYTISEVDENLTADKVSLLYSQNFANWTGTTTDTKELYSEVISAHLLENYDKFAAIKKITRESCYNVTHTGEAPDGDSNRCEERSAISMYRHIYDNIGEILNYQVPLKDKQADKAGKIDLVSYENKGDNGVLRIIEYKKDRSDETLLRCLLEIYTYFKTIDGKKLRKDFEHENARLVPTVLVFKDSKPYQDYLDKDQPKVKELMQKLDVELFVVSGDNAENYVIEPAEPNQGVLR
jgi:hypothetical protein